MPISIEFVGRKSSTRESSSIAKAADNSFGVTVNIGIVMMMCVLAAYHHAAPVMMAMVDVTPAL
jgi:hypothetical protein